ncbi:hypothetical protein NPIRD3C_0260 [Nitrosopumilus piranensis]|uniref:Uncharacterized protein n=1 Tax=Nitrosopumilus piranensis TaxID=1582439 RepID=A0A0C5BP64_9ARCH|nr:hypothetical protein NPIRD3C_0260 [Nitrosopumilus piranensis]
MLDRDPSQNDEPMAEGGDGS